MATTTTRKILSDLADDMDRKNAAPMGRRLAKVMLRLPLDRQDEEAIATFWLVHALRAACSRADPLEAQAVVGLA